MALTQVDVCNMALARLKQDTIESTGEDSEEARLCAALWDPARMILLGIHFWSFAEKVALLVATANTPQDYAYEYTLPADCIRPCVIVPSSPHIPIEFRRRAQTIVTNASPAYLRYTYDHDTVGYWSPTFSSVMAWQLAAEIASSLTDRPGARDACLAYRNRELPAAAAADAAESCVMQHTGSSYDDARA